MRGQLSVVVDILRISYSLRSTEYFDSIFYETGAKCHLLPPCLCLSAPFERVLVLPTLMYPSVIRCLSINHNAKF